MLPAATANGELPPGVHSADWNEIEERFGRSSEARVRAFGKLQLLYQLAIRTGCLARFLVFGSFVSGVPEPRDVDVVLVMTEDFRLEDAGRESRTLFSHSDADARFGASIFWLRQGMLPEDGMREFLATWQMKRDATLRGMLEVKP